MRHWIMGFVCGLIIGGASMAFAALVVGQDGYLSGWTVEKDGEEICDSPFARTSTRTLEDALPELARQARLSGAEAIIEIQEQRSQVGETKIYHVTAMGIRYQ